MKKMKQSGKAIWCSVKKHYSKHSSVRFITTLLCVTLLYIIMYSCFGGYFMTGDDMEMMKYLSGYYSGTPNSYSQFCSTPLGLLFKSLYSLFPLLSWYSLFYIGSSILCISIILYVLLERIRIKNRFQKLFTILLVITLVIAIFVYPLYILSFTLTSAFYATASVIMLLSLTNSKVDKSFYIKYSIVLFLLFMSQIVRWGSFEAVLPFFFLAFVCLIVKNRKAWRKRFKYIIIIATIILIALISAISKIDNYYKDNVVESEEFVQIKQYRSRFTDWLTLPYEGNEEVYDSLGWDESIYNLSRQWMFLDRRYNENNLKIIVSSDQEKKEELTITSLLQNTISEFRYKTLSSEVPIIPIAYIKKRTSALIALLVAIGSIGCFFCWKKAKKHLWKTFFFTAVNGLSALEIAYLCFKGRFIYRAFMCAALPTLCIDIYIFISVLPWVLNHLKDYYFNFTSPVTSEKKAEVKKFRCRLATMLFFFCFIASVFLMRDIMKITFNEENRNFRERNTNKFYAIEQYCLEHPESYYLHDGVAAANRDFLLRVKNTRGTGKNLLYWGGVELYSKSFYDAIHAFGYSEFFTDNLLDDNVYFMTYNRDLQGSTFLTYMRLAYGNDIQCYLTDTICDGAYVFKFFRPQKGDKSLPDSMISEETLFLSTDDNLNNSKFAAYLRTEFGNDYKLTQIHKNNSGLFVYKCYNNMREEVDMMVSDNAFYLLNETDVKGSELTDKILEDYQTDIQFEITYSISDDFALYRISDD